MPNLMDIAPAARQVKTSFGEVTVPGISITGLVCLAKQHPELIELLQKGEMPSTFTGILDLGLDLTASLLAAGLGYPGQAEAEARCREFKPGDAWDIGQAILEESFPGGVQGFFEKVKAAMDAVGLRALVEETGEKAPSSSSLKLASSS